MLLGVFAAFSLGCASATPQVDALLAGANTLPPTHMIEGVPFVAQGTGHCGPATLKMALQWSGKNISVDSLISQVYTPEMKGSLQADMISASRRQGMIAIPIEGFEALLQEINGDHPVIVFENLSVSWLPQWHYAIVFGYNLPSEKVIMHSGPEAFKSWDLRKFERSWSLGDYWGLVVLQPDHLSASANELAHVSAASSLEQIGQIEAASKAYQQILQRWPKSLIARIGLANISYLKKEYSRAVDFLRQATVDDPQSAVAWHNLVFAEARAGNAMEARRSALEAIRLASPDSRDLYVANLKEWLR